MHRSGQVVDGICSASILLDKLPGSPFALPAYTQVPEQLDEGRLLHVDVVYLAFAFRALVRNLQQHFLASVYQQGGKT